MTGLADPKRHELVERLAQARRQLRDEEQKLAQLRYEWNIARRLRNQAHSEEEREKWRIQSDVYMKLVVEQEGVVAEARARVNRRQAQLTELDARASAPPEAQ